MQRAEVNVPLILSAATMDTVMQVFWHWLMAFLLQLWCNCDSSPMQIDTIGSAAVWSHLHECMSLNMKSAVAVLHWTSCLEDAHAKERLAIVKRIRSM